jgi:hypothetical protein
MSDQVKAAMDLAWDIYISQLKDKAKAQHAEWSQRRPTFTVLMTPPSDEVLNLLTAALATARDAGIHESLVHIISLCDEMGDSGEKKDVRFRRHRARVNELLESVRAMKYVSLAVAK